MSTKYNQASRRETAVNNKAEREKRTDEQQVELARTRRGSSASELERLLRKIENKLNKQNHHKESN